MGAGEIGPAMNGWAPEVRSWRHVRIDRRSRGYCRVTFDHPPVNAVTTTTVAELAELVGLIEQDRDLNVVVFDSGNPDFYLTEDGADDSGADSPARLDVLVRLTRAPVVSVAAVRGRTCGAGTAFVLACDLRFASRERTALGRVEVRPDVAAGRDPAARLCHVAGRARALEILLGPDDVDGPRAQLYGFVNRVIADDRLDDEVERFAAGLAGLDHDAIGWTKARVDEVMSGADGGGRPA
jgi:enoyl-CoA hydratase/carnithine racemase